MEAFDDVDLEWSMDCFEDDDRTSLISSTHKRDSFLLLHSLDSHRHLSL